MTDPHKPEIQGTDDPGVTSGDPYHTSTPVVDFPKGHERRRAIAILLSVLVIPLLVAVAVAGGNGKGTKTAACSDPTAPGCATTTTPLTPTIQVPGNPAPPATTTTNSGGGFPFPPTTVSPPPVSPPPTTNNGSGNGNTNPPPTPPTPPTPPSPPSPPSNPPPTPGYDGPPKLTRSDGGHALFKLPNAAAGKTVSRCVTITYHGNPSARVRLYGTPNGTGLENYIDLKVIRGTSTSATQGSCTGFAADSTNYLGEGSGVIFDDVLSAFPATFEATQDEPAQADRERWTNGEKHTYRFEVRLRSDNGAQGLSVDMDFHWQARGY
jgi:hypothetical protein